MQLIINDIDGAAVHTVAVGDVAEVRGMYSTDHPVQALIDQALRDGKSQGTYDLDGEMYTTRVVVDADDEEAEESAQ